MTTLAETTGEPLSWKKSWLWVAVAMACFHAAYTSVKFPAAGLIIFGYAFALVRLTNQPSVRRAFYMGLLVGFLCYAPQGWFFAKIFNVAAVPLWLLLSSFVGLFTAIVCASVRRWGHARAAWLIPIVWTGIEYFRSELYYLKFSWLNIGYAVPPALVHFGMYGCGFLIFGAVSAMLFLRKPAVVGVTAATVLIFLLAILFLPAATAKKVEDPKSVAIVGIQMEFPPENVLPQLLNQALAKNPDAQIFVLSEYTLMGKVPEALKNWCREHSRYLVVGGEDPAGGGNYYDTAFVVGTNGDIVFKQGKCVPIQFFNDGLPAPEQKVWQSPWGKIGFCVCYDLSYTRVTDELVRQGAQLLIVPTMDIDYWGRHQHELHSRVAPMRAAEYGVPIFRLASSGISQAVSGDGKVVAQAPMPGIGATMTAKLYLSSESSLPWDRYFAPVCSIITALVMVVLLYFEGKNRFSHWKPQ